MSFSCGLYSGLTVFLIAFITLAQVAAAVEGLAKDGFVNYFGLQRFGSGASATHR